MEEFLKIFLDLFIGIFKSNTKVMITLSVLIIITFIMVSIFW